VKQNVDIWSLGCVYSEAARWVAGGYNGVKQYRAERKFETDSIRHFRDGDCFHNGEIVLKTIRACHRKIKKNLCREDFITELVIDRMIGQMLRVADGRPTAMQCWFTSQEILEEAQEKLESLNHNDSPRQQPNVPPLPRVLPPTPGLLGIPQSQSPTEGQSPIDGEYEDGEHSHGHGHSQSHIHTPDDDAVTNGAPIPANHRPYESARGGLPGRTRSSSSRESVGFDTYRGSSSGAEALQSSNPGIFKRSATGSLTHRPHEAEPTPVSASHRATLSDPLQGRPTLTIFHSAPDSGSPKDGQIGKQRTVSDSAAHPPSTPQGASPENGGQHQRGASYGSLLHLESPQAVSQPEKAKPVEQKPPFWSMEDASRWRMVRRMEDASMWRMERRNGRKTPVPNTDLLDRLNKRDHVCCYTFLQVRC
jgi:hypothetical protein